MTSAKILSQQHSAKERANPTAAQFHRAKNKTVETQALVHNAAKCIAPVWPLETFIACNPLQGFETQPFAQVLALRTFAIHATDVHSGLEEVNRQMIKWCTGFFDAGQGSIHRPHREKGFYTGFLNLVIYDKQVHQNKKEAKDFLRALPESAEEAIELCLLKLNVPQGRYEEFLAQTFSYLPGWAGFVKWKTEWQTTHTYAYEPKVSLSEFIAVRLAITCLLWPDALHARGQSSDAAQVKKLLTRLQHSETSYQEQLLNLLLPEARKKEQHSLRPSAQLVFCIDVRSEPFRRAIESLGHYETLGFAGFFGLPVRISELDATNDKECCPVLLKPRYAVKEVPLSANQATFVRYKKGKQFINQCKNLYIQLKHNMATPFALVESLGLWTGCNMVLKAIAPRFSKNLSAGVKQGIAPSILTKIAYDPSECDLEHGLSLDLQVTYAETVLRLMGLTSHFAKFVILCGHGGATENNPYASALDCGACGGNQGGINARLLASILNKPEVRYGLEDCGIHIPLDTVFYGALHNTTTDSVALFTEEQTKLIYPELLMQLQDDLKTAQQRTNDERGVKLGSLDASKDILRRSLDWSETRPEWGLARNAAFIAAPRHLTKNISLDGRCFLHSYRYEHDPEGTLLETILTAPMVVAEWINTQYLFSTLDNVAFGSGSKVTHNVVGKIGVMQGNASDLMHGLPLQSVMSSDEQAYHEPQRLLTVVYAHKETVTQVIAKHSILQTLFANEWVHLLVIDPRDQMPYKLNNSLQWIAQGDEHGSN